MKKNIIISIGYLLVFFIGMISGILLRQSQSTWTSIQKCLVHNDSKVEDNGWDEDFKLVKIKSSIDNNIQKAYFFKSDANQKRPLIVSLHTWSGDYKQRDELAELCKLKNLNYIHPNFRGPNWTKKACCSKFALSDIEDAISFAVENSNVDTSKIFVIGVSGGGYATLSSFMRLEHDIEKFSALASISDLVAWYRESKIRNNKYADNILACTNSENALNINVARKRSPIYWETPINKLKDTNLFIYAGIYDGIQGSVPITHSINFYNKLLNDLSVRDSSKYVSQEEKLKLLELRRALGDYGEISSRRVLLRKQYNNIKLVIFEGDHEMLAQYALNELLVR